jgi:hypothetical protein
VLINGQKNRCVLPEHKQFSSSTVVLLLPLHAMQPSAPDEKTAVPITAIGALLDNRYTASQVGPTHQHNVFAAPATA